VLGIFTGEHFKAVGGLPCGWLINSIDGTPMKEPKHPVLADGKVRYVGDRVALVVAETVEQAKAAAALIEVDYDELPAVVDTATATAGRPAVHDEAPDNQCYQWGIGDKRRHRRGHQGRRARHHAELPQQPADPERHGAARANASYDPNADNTRCTWPTRTRTSSGC
jgi:carbon-monoxide dehydrogenase large subunit